MWQNKCTVIPSVTEIATKICAKKFRRRKNTSQIRQQITKFQVRTFVAISLQLLCWNCNEFIQIVLIIIKHNRIIEILCGIPKSTKRTCMKSKSTRKIRLRLVHLFIASPKNLGVTLFMKFAISDSIAVANFRSATKKD